MSQNVTNKSYLLSNLDRALYLLAFRVALVEENTPPVCSQEGVCTRMPMNHTQIAHFRLLWMTSSIRTASIPNSRALVRTGARDEAAPINFGQQVHAYVNFQDCLILLSQFFIWFFLLMAKSCTRQLKSLTRALNSSGAVRGGSGGSTDPPNILELI